MVKIPCIKCDSMVDTCAIVCRNCKTPIGYLGGTPVPRKPMLRKPVAMPPLRNSSVSFPEGTFGQRFARIFQVLEDRGFGPQWQSVAAFTIWHPHPCSTGSSTREIIKCASGPIKAVGLKESMKEVGGADDPPTWKTTRSEVDPISWTGLGQC